MSSGTPPNASPQVIAEYVEGYDESGSLRAPKSHSQVWPWVKFESKVKVPVRGLDSWAAKHGIGRSISSGQTSRAQKETSWRGLNRL